MVTSIVPGAAGAGAIDADLRYAQRADKPAGAQPNMRPGNEDRVELSPASLAAARESVREGIAHAQEALALGRDAMSMLLLVQSVARGEGTQADLDAALGQFAQRLEAALERGVHLARGADISVQAEPDGAPVVINGMDLRLKQQSGSDDLLSVPLTARADDPALPEAAQRSLEKLQEAMSRLLGSVRALEAHQGFLKAVDGAAGVRRDLDTDGARLLALQVRQGLEAHGAAAIANVEPQAVLSLFRA